MNMAGRNIIMMNKYSCCALLLICHSAVLEFVIHGIGCCSGIYIF